ncbi:Membrane protein involved in the export of O-antigen and teichoic acid [Mucilaginibacter mallensis]|uniref:Membrane protein involved in the export of O-antigen and teichoic acid n=1 Tax=Mucilaginibacter mallensis TaxID=652787 RepID=A0A1H1PEP5_MUCMA|nr:oligosaccharide flippase family protein [Mucilaginibacter mallensis]SDS09736.1 Membrane protein involved in the export of O-antigen and teichoic acid [Mucilaginibacter mallensis]
MKIRSLQNLSANTIQLVINQFFSAVVFYILSVGLDKPAFGQINLALAVLLSVFNILSFGIDQLVVKKVAQGDDVPHVIRLYIGHALLTGLVFYGLLLLGYIVFKTSAAYNLILWIGAGKLFIFFSMPFKQVCSGLEKFRLLARMSVVSNCIRAFALLALMLFHSLTIYSIIITFVSGDALELIYTLYLFYRNTNYRTKAIFDRAGYQTLLKESMPQLGVVLITSALARFDWLFIGFMVSDVKLAEYSFAYKVFEISTFPMLAIAPLLIPRFTRYFNSADPGSVNLKFLIRAELIIAAFTVLVLNLSWEPVVNALTHGKYGSVNVVTVFILSLCIPALYLNNFLWTTFFAKGRLKLILHSFIIMLAVNVGTNVILIPLYGNAGAALAYLAACFAQTIFFLIKNEVSELKGVFVTMLVCTTCAVASGFFIRLIPVNYILQIVLAILVYIMLLFLGMQLKRNDRFELKSFFHI